MQYKEPVFKSKFTLRGKQFFDSVCDSTWIGFNFKKRKCFYFGVPEEEIVFFFFFVTQYPRVLTNLKRIYKTGIQY